MTTALVAATVAPLLLLPQGGLLAEAAYLKATFYAEHYGRLSVAQSETVEKSTTYTPRKSTTYGKENRPPTQQGYGKGELVVKGRVNPSELLKLVTASGWPCWASNAKLNALLMLVADAGSRIKRGVFPFSRDRARIICPSVRAKDAAACGAPAEGLAALVALGVFNPPKPGRRYPFARAAEYSFGDRYAKRRTFDVSLNATAKQANKWHERHDRICDSFERKNPIIPIVREAAARVEFSAQAMEILVRLPTIAPKKTASAQRCYRWLQAPAGKMTLDASGTLSTPISGCPQIIRPYLLLDRQDVVEMDISCAHIALLTRIYEPEFLAIYRIPHTPEEAQKERRSLTAQIEAGDIYGGDTKAERNEHKDRMLADLNRSAGAQMALKATEPLYGGRRIFTAAMWAVKKNDHRNLSHWLRRWTSDIVNPAVLSLHARNIPSIPIVDGLMIRERDAETACTELSSRLFDSTGVRAKVRVKDLKAKYAAMTEPETAGARIRHAAPSLI
jgi:hypothetical protein